LGSLLDNIDVEMVSLGAPWHKIAKIKYTQCRRGFVTKL
jgi:hypothetical protein